MLFLCKGSVVEAFTSVPSAHISSLLNVDRCVLLLQFLLWGRGMQVARTVHVDGKLERASAMHFEMKFRKNHPRVF